MQRKELKLKPGEKIEDLGNGYVIIQNPKYFSFGTDAILLGDFADVTAGERIVDFGTGCGIIPVLLCAKRKDISVTGIEIQPQLADMAKRSIALNGLEERVHIVCGDLKNAGDLEPYGVDVVTVNPPYEKQGAGKENANPYINIAKRELKCTLEDVVSAASRILRTGGRLYLIYRTERFAELMDCMRRCKVEPKRVMLVSPRQDKPPNFAIVEGRKGAGEGMTFLPSLAVYEPDGTYTKRTKEIYHIREDK